MTYLCDIDRFVILRLFVGIAPYLESSMTLETYLDMVRINSTHLYLFASKKEMFVA